MHKIFILLVSLNFTSITYAQSVTKADAVALQPQIGRDANGYNTCGIRAIVTVVNPKYAYTYDFSIQIMSKFSYGLLKAGKSSTPMKDMLKNTPNISTVMPAPINFWISQESTSKPVFALKKMPAETKGYLLEVADLFNSLDAINSIVNGERMHFAIRYKSESIDKVISFSSKLSDEETTPLMICISEVLERQVNALDAK
jgi:hypothetical protein